MSHFRVLHISDTHLSIVPNRHNVSALFANPSALSLGYMSGKKYSAFPSSYIPEVAEGAARFLFTRRNEIDCVAFSGDLATTGSIYDLEVALHFVSASTNDYICKNQPSIGFEKDRILLVPGNHDRYRMLGGAGSANFDLKFSAFWKRRPWTGRKILTRKNKRLAILTADFALQHSNDSQPPNFPYWLGQGKVYRDVLRSLEDRTVATRNEYQSIPILWMIHFPPVSNCSDALRLLDMDLLLEAAKNHNIPLILCGHLHSNAVYGSSDGIQILCAGSACSCEEDRNQWLHIIDFDVSSSTFKAVKSDYRWDDEEQDFTLVESGVTICA